jgi:hypothetical protein
MAGSFSIDFDSFPPIAKPYITTHLQDKATEIARNFPILRSDYLQEFRTFPINKDTALPCPTLPWCAAVPNGHF